MCKFPSAEKRKQLEIDIHVAFNSSFCAPFPGPHSSGDDMQLLPPGAKTAIRVPSTQGSREPGDFRASTLSLWASVGLHQILNVLSGRVLLLIILKVSVGGILFQAQAIKPSACHCKLLISNHLGLYPRCVFTQVKGIFVL